MKAAIILDVPEWQIGQKVMVYFPDTMQKEGVCESVPLHKKHIYSLIRTDEFSMRRLYEIICETLMDEGRLVISRTDDHEKVDFVWEIKEADSEDGATDRFAQNIGWCIEQFKF